jgi:hypothetical protein
MTTATTSVTTVIFTHRQPPDSVPVGTTRDIAWPKAYNDDERRSLLREIQAELDGQKRRECAIYTWDRPCRSNGHFERDEDSGFGLWIYDDDPKFPQQFPPQGMWAVAEFGYGALSFWEKRNGKPVLYVSSNDEPFQEPPILRYDTDSMSLFPRVSVVPLELLHVTVEEYIFAGQRPTKVNWMEIERQDLPELDPRW